MNESKQEFITIQKATKIYGFSSQILRKWEKAVNALRNNFETKNSP